MMVADQNVDSNQCVWGLCHQPFAVRHSRYSDDEDTNPALTQPKLKIYFSRRTTMKVKIKLAWRQSNQFSGVGKKGIAKDAFLR